MRKIAFRLMMVLVSSGVLHDAYAEQPDAERRRVIEQQPAGSLNELSGRTSDDVYYRDLRHYYSYDKTLPLRINPAKHHSPHNHFQLTFKSHDGETVHATITLPSDYRPDKQYPLYLGNPTLLGQELISTRQFIVADISMRLQGEASRNGLGNSSGSTPFATVWARLNTVIDYRRLLDYLEKTYSIDNKKILAGGYSRFGRVVTILAATDPRITGVIAASTSSDWLATVKTTAYESFRKTLQEPWFDETFYRRIMAPIDPKYFARFVRVPVLVLHGEADRIVTIEGARRLADDLGSRATLITYPGLGHSLQSPQVTMDVDRWISDHFFANAD